MIADSTKNFIQPATDGWQLNDNDELEIQYFHGNPYPDDIADISDDQSENTEDNDNANISSSDEDESDYETDNSSDEEPKS